MITAWSASRLSTYEICPRKARYLYVDKHKEPSGKAASEGLNLHKRAEAFMGKIRHEDWPEVGLPSELSAFHDDLRTIHADFEYECELQIALDSKLKRVDWFGPTVWNRAVLDLVVHTGPVQLTIIDYKTGKIREKDQESMDLYAMVGFATWPEVGKITTRLWYTKDGIEQNAFYVRKDHYAGLVAHWRERSDVMLSDRVFKPRTGPLCKWCAFSTRHAAEVDARYKKDGIDFKSLRLCEVG